MGMWGWDARSGVYCPRIQLSGQAPHLRAAAGGCLGVRLAGCGAVEGAWGRVGLVACKQGGVPAYKQ